MASSLVEDALTVDQAARRLGVSAQTVRRWIRVGRLPAYRVGAKRVRVLEADLSQMIAILPANRLEPVGVPSREDVLALAPLTPAEIERRLHVLQRLRERGQRDLERRGGIPFDDSTDIIREMRQERDRQLGYS
ncbi:MAG: DNA-binding protein [Dehalococcoidia bacterium]|nr:DNA-binding protein [Dehalococcoidia bacterium]